MRLHAHLGGTSNMEKSGSVSERRNLFWSEKMTYEEVFQNLLKSCLSFGQSLESSNAERGPCENPVRLSVHVGHMETVEYTWLNFWCMLD